MKIVIDDKIPFLKGVLEPFGNIVYLDGSEITHDSIVDCDAMIVRSRTICNRKLLDKTAIQFIGTTTIGTDHIDTEWCDNNGIKWVNAAGCNSGSVTQYITSSLLHLAHKHNFTLAGKTVGIVGVGSIGSKVEKMATALGIRVLLNDPPRERAEGSKNFVTLNKISEESDIITFHVPLIKLGQDRTINLAGEEFFAGLKKGCFIINSSRGGVVNEGLLIESLKSGRVKGAALDVWEGEPDINGEMLNLCDIATPHIAGYSQDGKYNASKIVLSQLASFFNIEPDIEKLKRPDPPQKSIIELNKSISTQDQIHRAVFATYNILTDDQKLRDNPKSFENIRNSYWQRREFNAYIISGSGEVVNTLKELGFN